MRTKIRRRWRRLLTMPVLVTLCGPFAVLGAPLPAGAREDPPTLPPMQVVVLVDESGSLSDADVVREREAARTIAFSVLAPDSVLSVVGFGSSNGPGQSAVDVVCPPTQLNAVGSRDRIATCVSQLHRRQPDEGPDTDHAAALQQALSFVQAGGPEHKLVFLLTDGKLDVSNSPAYGDTADRRNSAARDKVNEVLDDLDAAKAQVWPLGFGAVDQAALGGFARGKSCTPAAGNPRERVVSDSSELTSAVAEAFTSASCVKIDKSEIKTVERGGQADLHVTIPAIASEASILVYKRDPRVQVDYFAPGQDRPAPDAGGTTFDFAGQSTDVETVKVSDPAPGEWTIRLSSSDVNAEDVNAMVVYQAAVRAYLTVNPPQPVPGQEVGVEMQIRARERAITDPAALRDLTFVTTMAGDGFDPQQVSLADDDGDGTVTGRVTVPDTATGALTFTGQVTGIGIGGDTRVLSTRVQGAGGSVRAQILFDVNRATVHPGKPIPGRITVNNDSGGPVRLRLVVADASAGTALVPDPAVLSLPAGPSTTPFELTVGGAAALGPSSATLRLVDDADASVVVAERLFAAEVTEVPGPFTRYRWWFLALAVVIAIALAFLVIRLRARIDRIRVRGLTVRLYAAGEHRDNLPAVNPKSKVLRFVVHDDPVTGLQLQPASPGESEVYEVRRAAAGGLMFTAPNRPAARLGAGLRKDIGGNRAIVVDDSGTAVTEHEPVGPSSYDPFRGAPATMPIPGQRPEPETEPLIPASDPFGTPPAVDPFGTPADPFAHDFHSADPFGEPERNGSSRSAPSPASGSPFEDPGNPFR